MRTRCELVSFPTGFGTEPQPKSNLVHFSFKRRDLVAIIFYHFSENILTNLADLVQFNPYM